MANKHKGEVHLRIGEDDYRLVFNFDAICQAETVIGKTISEIVEDMQSGRIGANMVRGMLWGGLRKHHPTVSLVQAGDLIMAAGGAIKILASITEALTSVFVSSEGDGAAGPQNPDQAGTGTDS